MNEQPIEKPVITDLPATYLALIKNSLGSNMFRNYYASSTGPAVDIMKDGDLSCAYYVSSVLTILRLIERTHGTVSGTERDLRASSWTTLDVPRVGCVLVWDKAAQSHDEPHPHIGFYIGDDQAISNSWTKRQPVQHHWTMDDSRKITAMYWHTALETPAPLP